MAYYARQGESFEAVLEVGIAGLVGVLALQIEDNQGNVVVASSTANIIEQPPNSGAYAATRTAPATLGQYALIWTDDGSYSAGHTEVDDLVVVSSTGVSPLPPLTGSSLLGPCSAWTDSDTVWECCGQPVSGEGSLEEPVDMTVYADAASQVLFELSGRKFAGTCSKTVRPCRTGCGCGWQVLSRGHLVGWDWDNCSWSGLTCGCAPLPRVKLSGYPVRSISEVKIDGVALDPADYRLDESRYVTRVDGGTWPGCQDLALADTEVGTWSISYDYGADPPLVGMFAARDLACELYKACSGQECALPAGVSRVARQGLVMEKMAFARWGRADGVWMTGISTVDAFLGSYNPHGHMRWPVFWSPSSANRYAPRVG